MRKGPKGIRYIGGTNEGNRWGLWDYGIMGLRLGLGLGLGLWDLKGQTRFPLDVL